MLHRMFFAHPFSNIMNVGNYKSEYNYTVDRRVRYLTPTLLESDM